MTPFTVIIDDPAGTALSNLLVAWPTLDGTSKRINGRYTKISALGLAAPNDEAPKIAQDAGIDQHTNVPISDDEVLTFPGICSSCAHPIETRMKKVNIPYFKVITMPLSWCISY
jgi:zinc finger protein